VDDVMIGLQRLAAAQTKDHLIDAVWDLRDSAYDHPESWKGFTAEAFFQRLGEALEGASADRGPAVPADLLARVVGAARHDPNGT
jgi:hypothetical protein